MSKIPAVPERVDVAIVGAGPYGLSVAAHLAGRATVRVFGHPMETWRTRMPPKMLLRSAWEETSLSDPEGAGTIDSWADETGEAREEPIPLEKFLRYSEWFADKFVPDLRPVEVTSIERTADGFALRTDDGRETAADRVVIAIGVAPFAYAPPPFDRELGSSVRFAVDRLDFERYRGRRVAVVGGGQGGLEAAALAADAGADVELIVRSRLHWFTDREPHHPRGPMRRRLYRLAYPAIGYGPPVLNRLAVAPDLLAALPQPVRDGITGRAMRGGGSPWIRAVGERVRRTERTTVTDVRLVDGAVQLELSDATTRDVDDVIVSTGFRFSLDRLGFVSPDLRAEIDVAHGWPALDRTFQTSVPNLFFVGYAAEGRFGPLCRFVLGTQFTATRVATAIAPPLTVILAGDDHHGSLGALRALRGAGHDTWLASHLAPTYATRSRAARGVIRVPGPRANDDVFAERLAQAASEVGARVVLPGSEATLVALARARHLFPADVVVGAPAPEIVERAIDKAALPELVTEAGLSMPPTTEIGRADLNGSRADIPFPAVVKPLRTKTFTSEGFRHGRVTRVDDAAGLARVARELPGDRWLVQPFLDGRLDAVAGVAWDGELVCALHQVAIRVAPPDTGASAYAVTIPRNEELEAGVAQLLRSIGWSGLFQIQFIKTDDGTFTIDFNPRVYGSLSLAVAAGMNLPAIWVDLLLGRDPQIAPYRVGVRYRAEEKDVRALAREALAGRPARALRGALPRRDTVHAVFEAGDPMPLLTSLGKIRSLGR